MIDVSMLDEILESLLLVSGGGLKVEEIATHLEIKNVRSQRFNKQAEGKVRRQMRNTSSDL